jgi:hypothetical protein
MGLLGKTDPRDAKESQGNLVSRGPWDQGPKESGPRKPWDLVLELGAFQN